MLSAEHACLNGGKVALPSALLFSTDQNMAPGNNAPRSDGGGDGVESDFQAAQSTRHQDVARVRHYVAAGAVRILCSKGPDGVVWASQTLEGWIFLFQISTKKRQ